ncbi:MAG: putative DNA-binding domain-containing protein [Chlamydiota bacterium]
MTDSKVPSSLLDMQKWFVGILLEPIRDLGLPLYDVKRIEGIEKRISASPRLTALQRIGIYNQQFWFRLFVLMQNQYPTLTALFGFDDFNRLIVEPYILKNLPNHWYLPFLGEGLLRWIEEEYTQEDKSLISQIAAVDAAHERVFHRPSLSPLSLKDFEDASSPFYLQSCIALLEIGADLFAFRKELIAEEPEYWIEHDFPLIQWFKKDVFYVLYLENERYVHEEITLAQKTLLEAFQKGSTLSCACNLLKGELAEEAGKEIGSWFQTWAAKGWFTREAFP